jgi:hypothetical protein
MAQPILAALAACGVLALASTPAGAAQIFVSNISYSDGFAQVTVSDFDGPGGFAGGSIRAGRLAITANPGTSLDAGSTSVFTAWCVDVFRTLSIGPSALVYTTGELVDDAATPPNPLSAAQISRINGLAAEGDTLLAAPGSQTAESAAVQMAIWQTLYPTATLTTPNAAAQALFATLVGTSFSGGGAVALQNFDAEGRLGRQTLIGNAPGGDPFEVPAPAALGLFGLALAGLLAARRWRG